MVVYTDRCVVIGCLLIDLIMSILTPIHRMIVRFTSPATRTFLLSPLSSLFFQFVSATFWGIYSVDRELIFPKVYDELIPPWLNHALVSS